MKVRNRLTYLFTAIVATLMLAFSVGIYLLSANYREREFYELLREKAITTSRLLYEAKQKITPQTLRLIEEQDQLLLYAEKIDVFDDNNVLLYSNYPDPKPINHELLNKLRKTKSGEIQWQEGEQELLYKLYPEKDKILIVKISAIDKYGLSKQRFLMIILFCGWTLCVVMSLLAGRAFAGNALQPIADVVYQVEHINFSTLAKGRVTAGNERDEIAQLANTFNRMLDRLQESFVIQRSFVSNASHELRTPLTVMAGQIEVALMHERTVPDYQSLLGSLHEEVQNMTDLSNTLLDMALASSDLSTIPFAKKRLDEVILQAEADLLRKKPTYNVIVNFLEAPDEEELYELVVNERLLKNAFINLMENACKFSLDHMVEVRIAFRTQSIVLLFIDKGIGIQAEELAYIFQPFFRSKNAAHVAGHGLGLSLVQRIVEMHQGQLSVSSHLGTGTTFTLVLPRAV